MKITISRILCPTDFSESSDYALEYALCIADRHDADVELLHVTESSIYAAMPLDGAGERYTADLVDRLKTKAAEQESLAGRISVNVIDGIDYIEIVRRAAEWAADLIVMGTHGRTGLKHLLIGSVSERVVRTATCPVCTVRHPKYVLEKQ